MNARWILCLLIAALLITGGVATAGTAAEDLKFAEQLGIRGLNKMAEKVLNDMIASRDPAKQRNGRYGKALITKQEAQLAAMRYIRALENNVTPPVSREDVIKLFSEAAPEIEAYVKSQEAGSDAAFLLAETLVEHAEFLVGGRLPEYMKEQRAALVTEHKKIAEDYFDRAMNYYRAVAKAIVKAAGGKLDPDSPEGIRHTQAQFNEALTSYRLALVYPKGARFNGRAADAEEILDNFMNDHFGDLVGGYAMLYLGKLNHERAVRTGDADAGEVALNYFETVAQDVNEDPNVRDTTNVLGEALYRYCQTANALARADGDLKKMDPARYGDCIRMGTRLRQKMRFGSKSRFALLALLEVADAHAAQGDFEKAVGIAGEVLTKARSGGLSSVTRTATEKLTDWVANVGGAGSLPPTLLTQIGSSLAAEGNAAKAVTFFEKAIAASTTPEDIEQVAHDARRRIAESYRRDKRYFAAGIVAWGLVESYLKSGEGAESAFYQTASEACWQAAQSWKAISDATKRGEDKSHYEKVLKTFRDEFPDHPKNADAAFSEALDLYAKEDYAAAAKRFLAISSNSPSYWSAQLRVPVCYRRLATEKDKDSAAKWHAECLKASQALYALASAKMDVPRAKAAARTAMLTEAGSYHSLKQWDKAASKIDEFFAAFPGVYPKKGYEFTIQIDSLLAQNKVEEAEAALAQLKQALKTSGYIRRLNYDVYRALRKKYKPLGGRERAAIAGRAATLWSERIEATPANKRTAGDYWFLGDVLRAAQDWEGAGSAYEDAANLAAKPGQKAGWQLLAAEMAFKNARQNKDRMDPTVYRKTMDKTRQLFTGVLIPDSGQAEKLLPILANGQKWPSKEQWRWIVAKPGPLLTAAEVFGESSPKGLDGRWVGVRLLDRLHKLTKPVAEEGTRQAEFVNLWWDGAQLKLELYLAIAESQSSQAWSKRAAEYGYSFARRLITQYTKMDGEERVAALERLSKQLAALRR